MPDWILAISYFVHMVATIIWVGGIAMLALIVYPVTRKVLSGNDVLRGTLIAEINRQFSPLAMISLGALIVTGLSQMAVSPYYTGLLQIDNAWAWALLLKHIAFGVMTVIGAYSIWVLTPSMTRLALLEARGKMAGDDLAMISLGALIVTGLSQMAVSPYYTGLLQIDNAWAWALLLKHIAFGVMTVIGAYSIWVLTPSMTRLALLEARGKMAGDDLARLRRREERLNQLNFGLALVVLLFTAVARSV